MDRLKWSSWSLQAKLDLGLLLFRLAAVASSVSGWHTIFVCSLSPCCYLPHRWSLLVIHGQIQLKGTHTSMWAVGCCEIL